MKKLFLLPVTCLLLSLPVLSQKAVTGYLEGGISLYAAWKDGSKAAYLPSFTVGPGVKFLNTNSFSIVLNIPCTVGWNLDKGTYFGINVPAMLSLNLGSASGNDPNSKYGFVIGAGAGYTNIVNYYEDSQQKRAHKEFWGYQLRAGISFDKAGSGINGPMILFNFGKSITTGRGYVAGLSLLIGGSLGK